jgi:hypothetical protein
VAAQAKNPGAGGTEVCKGVRTGTHRFTVKDLSLPRWSAAQAVIGEEIILTARTDGFEEGDAGVFEILDSHNVVTILEIVSGKARTQTARSTGGEMEAEGKLFRQPYAQPHLIPRRIRQRSGVQRATTPA